MVRSHPLLPIGDLTNRLPPPVRVVNADAFAQGIALQTLGVKVVGGIIVADVPQELDALVFFRLDLVLVQVRFALRLHALAFRVTKRIVGSEPMRKCFLKLSAPRRVALRVRRRRPLRSMYSTA
jgi:hypothetical protein